MIHLTKHHGLGNDFLVLLDERQSDPVAVDEQLARALCDRHRGVGADGLLHGLAPGAGDPTTHGAMRLYNADGSLAEMSGNGVRCFAQALAISRSITSGELMVTTDAGVKRLVLHAGSHGETEFGETVLDDTVLDDTVLDDTVRGETVLVEVDMGGPQPGPAVPTEVAERLEGRRFGTVDMGNPHLVVLGTDAEPLDLAEQGPWFDARFPGGINTELITVDRSPAPGAGSSMELTVFERGAGLTQACGTGACAAAVQASGWGLVGDRVTVTMPGGTASVALRDDGGVTLIGPSVHIADLEVPT